MKQVGRRELALYRKYHSIIIRHVFLETCNSFLHRL